MSTRSNYRVLKNLKNDGKFRLTELPEDKSQSRYFVELA